MNITDIENALYDWVSSQTGITTMFALQPLAVRPTTSYATINVFTTSALGTKETESTIQGDDSINNIYSAQKQFTASINIYYAGAYEVAEALRNSLHKVSVCDALWASGIGFQDSTEAQRLPNVVDEAWEERAQFDITFHYRSEVTENIATIQHVELTNEIDGTTAELPPVPIVLPTVYSNDYTSDPIGTFDIANSDIIDPLLSYDSQGFPGEIVSGGLSTSAGNLTFLGLYNIADTSSMIAEFIVSDLFRLGVEIVTFVPSDYSSATGITASSDGSDIVITAVSPSTSVELVRGEWLNSLLCADISIEGNDLSVIFSVDGAEVYNGTTTLVDLSVGERTYIQFNNSLFKNFSIKGNAQQPQPANLISAETSYTTDSNLSYNNGIWSINGFNTSTERVHYPTTEVLDGKALEITVEIISMAIPFLYFSIGDSDIWLDSPGTYVYTQTGVFPAGTNELVLNVTATAKGSFRLISAYDTL